MIPTIGVFNGNQNRLPTLVEGCIQRFSDRGSTPLGSTSGKLPLPIIGDRQSKAEVHHTMGMFGFDCFTSTKKFDLFDKSNFFIQADRLVISSPYKVRCISSANRVVYHHALACIFCRINDIQRFRI